MVKIQKKEPFWLDSIFELAACLNTLLLVLLAPVLIFCMTPIYIYRYLLRGLAKVFRPDLHKILSFGNAFLASTDKFTGDTQNTTVIVFKVAGIPDIDESRKIITDKLLEAKFPNGKLKYCELRKYPSSWMGYYFWKPDAQFDVKNHVNYYVEKTRDNETSLDGVPPVYSEEDASRIETELVTKPHTEGRSPWEVVILAPVKSDDIEDESEYSYVYYRNHHLMTDGYGILNLIREIWTTEPSTEIAKPDFKPRSRFQTFVYFFIQFLRIPYDFFEVPTRTGNKLRNKFRLDNKKLAKKHIGSKPLCVPLEDLKKIRKAHGVSMTAVQYAAWVGGLRRTMEKANLKIPQFIQCTAPQPLPFQHPEKMRIFAGLWLLLLPVAIEDSVERLKAIEKLIRHLKRSAQALANYYMVIPIFGPLPIKVQNFTYPMASGTSCLNCFPGPDTPISIFNKEVKGIHFSYGQTKALFSTLFSSISYCGNVYMKTTINTNIYTKTTDVEQFHNNIYEEIQALSKETV